ncbi:MAG TPA: hypothetical protein VIM07_10395, partial [Chitinophagaceae bacterium]
FSFALVITLSTLITCKDSSSLSILNLKGVIFPLVSITEITSIGFATTYYWPTAYIKKNKLGFV